MVAVLSWRSMAGGGGDPELEALRAGDERTFESLIQRYHGPLLRLAQAYVGERALAEEVVQEIWLTVLQSLPRFEGRSSLKTWIFGIAANVARSRRRRESRSLPFSSLFRRENADEVVDAGRFDRLGAWVQPPSSWAGQPEERLLGGETRERIEAAIGELPERQREVIVLRDVAGLGSAEVCRLLRISPENQRVRLHRARAHVRRRLEEYLR